MTIAMAIAKINGNGNFQILNFVIVIAFFD